MKQTAQELIRSKLKLRHLASFANLRKNHPHADSFFKEVGFDLGKVRQHSTKLLTAGTLGGALLLSAPDTSYAQTQSLPVSANVMSLVTTTDPLLSTEPDTWMVERLQEVLPIIKNAFSPPFLTPVEEKMAGKVIEKATGIRAVGTLEGEHLNTTYGYIGAEQHLLRFPGDTIAQHNEPRAEGMAPSRGAFGWFSDNGKLTQEVINREKYYVAVQTLYLPDWNKRTRYLWNWYKWRKVIVVNVENGNAAVAVVGDAGPAAWTGKHFGGSPEVMNILGGSRYKKGKALLFFIDDPENKIPLGKVDYNKSGNTIVNTWPKTYVDEISFTQNKRT